MHQPTTYSPSNCWSNYDCS